MLKVKRDEEGTLTATATLEIGLGKVFEPKEDVVHMPPAVDTMILLYEDMLLNGNLSDEQKKETLDQYYSLRLMSDLGMKFCQLGFDGERLSGMKEDEPDFKLV